MKTGQTEKKKIDILSLILSVIAVLTIFADGMPFFGRLMFVRGTAIFPGDVLAALLMLIIISWCGFRIKQLDFI